MSEITLGACLVANEPDGLAEALVKARADGKSWKQIADEYGYGSPSAARSAFKKATGIDDFKIKGPAIKDLWKKKKAGGLGDDLAKMVSDDAAEAAAKKKAAQAAAKKPKTMADALNDYSDAYKLLHGELPTDQHLINMAQKGLGKVDELTQAIKQKIASNAQKGGAAASKAGKEAAKKAAGAEDWIYKPKVASHYDETFEKIERIIQAHPSKTYTQIAQELGLDIPTVDKYAYRYYLDKNKGDVWKAFLEKPTSHEGASHVIKMWSDSVAHGVDDALFMKKTGVDRATLKAIKEGKWGPAKPGSYTYTPPGGAKVYNPPSPNYGQASFSAGSTGTNYPNGDHEQLLQWMKSLGNDLDADDLYWVREYTGSTYRTINSAARSGQHHRSFPAIDGSMRPAPHSFSVVRGGDRDMLQGMNPKEMIGTVYTDKAYMSTSVGGGFNGNTVLHIDIPAGTPVRYVQPVSNFPNEREVLLPREIGLMVEGVKEENGVLHVFMRVVKHGITG